MRLHLRVALGKGQVAATIRHLLYSVFKERVRLEPKPPGTQVKVTMDGAHVTLRGAWAQAIPTLAQALYIAALAALVRALHGPKDRRKSQAEKKVARWRRKQQREKGKGKGKKPKRLPS